MTEYHCRVYGAGGVEAQSTHLHIDAEHIRLTDAAYANNPLPFDQVQLELVGSGPYCLQLKVPGQELTIVVTDVELVNKLAALPSTNKLGQQARALRSSLVVKHHSNRAKWMLVGGALLVMPVLFFIFLYSSINQAIAQINPTFESRLGDWIAQAQERAENRKAAVQARRVDVIGRKLVAHISDSPYKFHFFVELDPTVNACAYPGGVVVVKTGLAEAADDDELAGVIGHEIGHVLHRDTLRATCHDLGLGLSFSAFLHLIGMGGDSNDLTAQHLAELMEKLDSLNFSRGQEAAADKEGVRLAMKAGFSGDGLVKFFENESKKAGTAGGAANKLTGLLSTHPLDEERAVAIRKEIELYRAEQKRHDNRRISQ